MENILVTDSASKSTKIKSALVLIAASTAIIFALYYVMLFLVNLYPFSGTVASQYDLLAQIVPFAENFFDVIDGNASLFYSYRIGAGMDIFGTVVYCLISPFSFIFWIFGEGNVWAAASLMVPLKLACIAASAVVMIKLTFPKMHFAVILPTIILYAFCGYTFVANTYINWMDFLIYFPLAIPAFRHMVKTGKIIPFVAVLSATIYTCFSIACFSMLLSFPILVLYAFLVVEKGKKRNYLFQLCLSYLCAVIAALPLMIPALKAYLASGRNTGLFENLWNSVSVGSYYPKLSYILSDCAFVILIMLYFIKSKFKDRLSRFLGVAGLIILVPVLVDEACNLMNMGSYMSYAFRFGFLNAVYELYVSCIVLECVTFHQKTVFERKALGEFNVTPSLYQKNFTPLSGENGTDVLTQKERFVKITLPHTGIGLLLVLFSMAACVLIFEVYAVACQKDGIDVSGISWLSSLISSAKQASEGFASSFAHSCGGLEGVAILFLIVGIIAILSCVVYEHNLLPVHIIYPCIVTVLFAQVLFYGFVLVDGNAYNHVRYDQFDSVYSSVCAIDDEPNYKYRIKDYDAYISDNQGLITKTNSYSFFTSVADTTNFNINRVFGFGGNDVNSLKSSRGNLFGNCLLSNKYYFYNSEGDEASRPTLSDDYLFEVSRDVYFIMYENVCSFPSAYTVPTGDMGVVCNYNNYVSNMRNLYTFLGGEGDVFTTVALTDKCVLESTAYDPDTKEAVDVIWVKIYLDYSGDYTFDPGELIDSGYRYYTASYVPSQLADASQIKTYNYHNQSKFNYYSYYIVNQDHKLTVQDVIDNCSVKVIQKSTMLNLKKSLQEREQDYTFENNLFTTRYKATVNCSEANQSLFLNYVSLKGMKATVNGKEVALQENGLNMICVPLQEGENEVVISYTSPYIYYGLAALAVSVVVLLGIAFLYSGKRKQKFVAIAKTPVAVAAVVLTIVIVGFFMLFPTGVMFYKLIFY